MGRGVNMPWVGGQYTMGRGVKIPWVQYILIIMGRGGNKISKFPKKSKFSKKFKISKIL